MATAHRRDSGGRRAGGRNGLANAALADSLGAGRGGRRGRGGAWCPGLPEFRRARVGPGTAATVAVDRGIRSVSRLGAVGFSRCIMVAAWNVVGGGSADVAVRPAGVEQLGWLLPDSAEGLGRPDLRTVA